MRTKTLLLTAALGIASVATSMAQAVYSVNVVGYVNLTMTPGFNLVANQLDATPDNKLNSVLPSVPAESQVLKFAGTDYVIAYNDGTSWITELGDPSPLTVSPGEGFFFSNPNAGNLTVTLVGQVRTGNALSVPLPAGLSLISVITPQEMDLSAANSFPQTVESQYLTYSPATLSYTALYNDGTGWITELGAPANARPLVGQGFFYNNAGTAVSWVRNFNPNTP